MSDKAEGSSPPPPKIPNDTSASSSNNDGATDFNDTSSERNMFSKIKWHCQPYSLSVGYEVSPIVPSTRIGKIKIIRRSQFCRNPFYNNLHERRHKTFFNAISVNDIDTVKEFLETSPCPHLLLRADPETRTPLHLAACKGYVEIVKLLLLHGANPNARDLIGNTPLHLAACTNNIDVFMVLLKAGSDPVSIDRLGRSPIELAKSKLKILQRSSHPDHEVIRQVSQIIEMLLHFINLKQEKNTNMELSLLNDFQKKLDLTESREEVDNHLKHLLDNLTDLKL